MAESNRSPYARFGVLAAAVVFSRVRQRAERFARVPHAQTPLS